MSLRRFWFEFQFADGRVPPADLKMGCGVTGWTKEDALTQIRSRIFGAASLPQVAKAIEDIDVSTLDPNHVRPNMSSPVGRGIWFPLGYE